MRSKGRVRTSDEEQWNSAESQRNRVDKLWRSEAVKRNGTAQTRNGKEMNCKAKESRGVEPRSEGTVENRTDVKRLSEDMTREATALHRSDEQRNGTAAHRLVVEQNGNEPSCSGFATKS